jgi:hypothetical protein
MRAPENVYYLAFAKYHTARIRLAKIRRPPWGGALAAYHGWAGGGCLTSATFSCPQDAREGWAALCGRGLIWSRRLGTASASISSKQAVHVMFSIPH